MDIEFLTMGIRVCENPSYLKEGKVLILVNLDSKDGVSWSLNKTP